MNTLFYRLFSAWHFWKIRDTSYFYVTVNWLIPVVLSAITTTILYLLGSLCHNNALKDALKLFAAGSSQYFFFPGFFLTALAAIAVFDKKNLDCQLPGRSMSICITGRGGIAEERPLTRRLLLSLMFSFLTVHSLTFCIVLLLVSCFGTRVSIFLSTFPHWVTSVCLCVSLFFIVMIFLQILLNMLIGLYYLGERFPANYDIDSSTDNNIEQ